MPYLDAAVGGGTMTAYLGAVDHRVTAAVRGLSDQLYAALVATFIAHSTMVN